MRSSSFPDQDLMDGLPKGIDRCGAVWVVAMEFPAKRYQASVSRRRSSSKKRLGLSVTGPIQPTDMDVAIGKDAVSQGAVAKARRDQEDTSGENAYASPSIQFSPNAVAVKHKLPGVVPVVRAVVHGLFMVADKYDFHCVSLPEILSVMLYVDLHRPRSSRRYRPTAH